MSERVTKEKERRLSVSSPAVGYFCFNASNANSLLLKENESEIAPNACSQTSVTPTTPKTHTHIHITSNQLVREDKQLVDKLKAARVDKSGELNKVVQIGMDRYLKRKLSPMKGNINKVVKNDNEKKIPHSLVNNRFALLSEESNKSSTNTVRESRSRPPPIYLRERSSNSLVTSLSDLIGKDTFHIVPLRKGNISETKIQVYTETGFRTVSKFLEDSKKSFYTYQLKSSKGLMVVLKGIEPDVETNEIKIALEEKGFHARSVVNILNSKKVPQPMFRVELQPDARKLKRNEVHPIYKLDLLLHRRISVEEPLKRKGPVQCQNCQEFGHTKAYCKLPTVCVVCGDLHSHTACKVTAQEQKKCSNCGKNHSANYRGCTVYKDLKKRLNAKVQSIKELGNAPCPVEIQLPSVPERNATSASYADVLRSNGQRAPAQSQNGLESMILQLTQTMNMFMNSMQSMMQEFMRNQNQLIQALLSKK